ncbi:lipoprotein chaperone [Rickettsiales bacterium Ac37b]|nr:lipoprotein chaperone [Rickettsiales bacterium Ac37b]
MNRFILIFTYIISSYIFYIPVSLAANQTNGITFTQNNDILKRAALYLNSLTTLVADFHQVSPNGEISNGKFFLSRPGKLRIQYNPPVPIVMTINGSLISYYDYELDQLSHSTAHDNLASFLTRKNISFFSSDIKVKMVDKSKGLIRIKLTKANKSKDGELTLIFNDYPFTLKKLDITDAEGNTTSVSLSNTNFGTKIDSKLFVLTKKAKY